MPAPLIHFIICADAAIIILITPRDCAAPRTSHYRHVDAFMLLSILLLFPPCHMLSLRVNYVTPILQHLPLPRYYAI